MIEHPVTAEQAGARLDALIRRLVDLSQKNARALCAIGAVTIDGVPAAGTARVFEGSVVGVRDETLPESLMLGLPVLHSDDAILVVDKPAGLAVHGGPLVEDSVADRLRAELPGSGLCHRLDREASGLLLIGRTEQALRAIGEAMERGDIGREYDAVVHGVLEADERSVDLPLAIVDEPRGDRPKAVVSSDGQRAVSHVRVLARRRGETLVRVDLETGRTHQVRAHLAAIEHPILGDPRYGDAAANERARQSYGVSRTLLHGARLTLRQHPGTGEALQFEAPRAPDIARLFPLRRN